MITAQRAIVRPRAFSPTSGDSLPLVDLVAEALTDARIHEIQIVGKPAGGKTTALRHLAAALPAIRFWEILDDGSPEAVAAAALKGRVIFTHFQPRQVSRRLLLTLAPWNDDDLLECLLATHPEQCASVLRRLESCVDKPRLTGNPTLWRLVLDEFAADPQLTSIAEAIRRGLSGSLKTNEEWKTAGDCSLAILLRDDVTAVRALQQLVAPHANFERLRPLKHRYAQHLVAANRICLRIADPTDGSLLPQLPESLVSDVAARVQNDEVLRGRLEKLLTENRQQQAMAASILLATDRAWRPPSHLRLDLANGYLKGASWRGLTITSTEKARSNWQAADFSRADLSKAKLDWANMSRARFAGATLVDSSLEGIRALQADFTQANLSGANLDRADLRGADLRRAHLRGASMIGVELDDADLRRTDFRDANLTYSVLLGCQIARADFSGANLKGVVASALPLRQSILAGASFREADLTRCDLEGVSLTAPCFFQANLAGALLTGSVLPRADFRYADLNRTGLADIHWEGADLRGADLRGCTFHMGSTRSGLVGSPYPGHGSKTGFYTDDYFDQGFKHPEEIRKANLCGADLRGAWLEGVDFYLVDLRGAKFDQGIAEHLQQDGAILADRSA